MAATIFHEQGAPTLRITKLLGNDELELEAVTPFSAGLAAEVRALADLLDTCDTAGLLAGKIAP